MHGGHSVGADGQTDWCNAAAAASIISVFIKWRGGEEKRTRLRIINMDRVRQIIIDHSGRSAPGSKLIMFSFNYVSHSAVKGSRDSAAGKTFLCQQCAEAEGGVENGAGGWGWAIRQIKLYN